LRLLEYALRRLLLLIPVIAGVTVITFAVSNVIPGDVARAYCGHRCPAEQLAAIHERLGLDRPLYEQYWIYMQGLLAGDLGMSLSQRRPVADALREGFPATAELAFVSLLIAVPLGILGGVVSAVHRDKWPDHVTRFLAIAGVSVPVFWLGMMLQYGFATSRGFCGRELFGFIEVGCMPLFGRQPLGFEFPDATGLRLVDAWVAGPVPEGYTRWGLFVLALKHLALPAITLGYATAGIILRMTRSSMLEVLNEDYVRTARAKGVPEWKVHYKHALRNALIPTVTVIGLAFGGLLAGAVLTETIFEINGMGRMAVRAVSSLDFAMIMGVTLVIAVVYVITNLVVDLLYALLDPRVRLE
jgi:ABC-type dipeptide/oligopeptide/nickel transport system permease component